MTCQIEPALSAAMSSHSAILKPSKPAQTPHQRSSRVDIFFTLTVLGHGLNDNRAALHGKSWSILVATTTRADPSIVVVLCSNLPHSVEQVNKHNAIHQLSHSPPHAHHHSLVARVSEGRTKDNNHPTGSTGSSTLLLNPLSSQVSLGMPGMGMGPMGCRTAHWVLLGVNNLSEINSRSQRRHCCGLTLLPLSYNHRLSSQASTAQMVFGIHGVLSCRYNNPWPNRLLNPRNATLLCQSHNL